MFYICLPTILFTGSRGGRRPPFPPRNSLLADIPVGRHPLAGADTGLGKYPPPWQTPPRQTPPGQTPHPLPRDSHCSARYASVLNEFLFWRKSAKSGNFSSRGLKLVTNVAHAKKYYTHYTWVIKNIQFFV